MKTTIIAAIFALSLHAAAHAETATAGDHAGFEPPASASDSKLTAIPETGAVVLGLVGAILLLRRRR